MSEISLDDYYDATVFDSEGEKVGGVGQVFLDEETGEPSWVTVRTGLFGLKESFVPLVDARLEGEKLHVAFPAEFIKDAPKLDPEAPMTVAEEDNLQAYYGTEDEPEKMPQTQHTQEAELNEPGAEDATQEPAETVDDHVTGIDPEQDAPRSGATAAASEGVNHAAAGAEGAEASTREPEQRVDTGVAAGNEEDTTDVPDTPHADTEGRDRSFEDHPNSEFPQNPDAQNPAADTDQIRQNSPEDDGEKREWVAPGEHKDWVEPEKHVYPHQTDFADEADEELIEEAEKLHEDEDEDLLDAERRVELDDPQFER